MIETLSIFHTFPNRSDSEKLEKTSEQVLREMNRLLNESYEIKSQSVVRHPEATFTAYILWKKD